MTTMANHLTALPSTTTVDEIVDVIHRDGGVIVEDFFDTPPARRAARPTWPRP